MGDAVSFHMRILERSQQDIGMHGPYRTSQVVFEQKHVFVLCLLRVEMSIKSNPTVDDEMLQDLKP